jgi:hypothetical protein
MMDIALGLDILMVEVRWFFALRNAIDMKTQAQTALERRLRENHRLSRLLYKQRHELAEKLQKLIAEEKT